MFCATWYYLYNLKNVKKTHGGVLISFNLFALCYQQYDEWILMSTDE